MPYPMPPSEEPYDPTEPTGPPPHPAGGLPLDHPLYQKEMAAMQQQEISPHNMSGLMANVGAPIDHRPTVSEQLAMRKAHLEHELAQVNAAIDQALQNQPTMKLLDSIAKVGLR